MPYLKIAVTILQNDVRCAKQLCVALVFACKERGNSDCASITEVQDHVSRTESLKFSEGAWCCCVRLHLLRTFLTLSDVLQKSFKQWEHV